MKITKKQLQRIIQEEIQNTLAEVTPPPEIPSEPQHTKPGAVAGMKKLRQQGTGAVSAVAGMTPLEGSIESRLQALHAELVEKGEVNAATVVKQHIERALMAAKGGQQ